MPGDACPGTQRATSSPTGVRRQSGGWAGFVASRCPVSVGGWNSSTGNLLRLVSNESRSPLKDRQVVEGDLGASTVTPHERGNSRISEDDVVAWRRTAASGRWSPPGAAAEDRDPPAEGDPSGRAPLRQRIGRVVEDLIHQDEPPPDPPVDLPHAGHGAVSQPRLNFQNRGVGR